MSVAASPTAWLLLAHAALRVRLMPRRWKALLRFMVTVLFIAWKTLPKLYQHLELVENGD